MCISYVNVANASGKRITKIQTVVQIVREYCIKYEYLLHLNRVVENNMKFEVSILWFDLI